MHKDEAKRFVMNWPQLMFKRLCVRIFLAPSDETHRLAFRWSLRETLALLPMRSRKTQARFGNNFAFTINRAEPEPTCGKH